MPLKRGGGSRRQPRRDMRWRMRGWPHPRSSTDRDDGPRVARETRRSSPVSADRAGERRCLGAVCGLASAHDRELARAHRHGARAARSACRPPSCRPPGCDRAHARRSRRTQRNRRAIAAGRREARRRPHRRQDRAGLGRRARRHRRCRVAPRGWRGRRRGGAASPLALAACAGREPTLLALLDAGADVESHTADGSTLYSARRATISRGRARATASRRAHRSARP